MIILDGTTETLTIATSSTADIDYIISYADIGASSFAPGSVEGKYVAANTANAALGSPAASTQRQVKLIIITNRHATTNNTIIVKKYVPTNEYFLTPSVTLAAGESMQYMDGQGWTYYAANGTVKGNLLGAAGGDKSVQFNNGGTALGADTDFTYDNVGHRLSIGTVANSGSIALGGDATDETAAPANQLIIYSKNIASKMIPKWIGPAGLDNPIQPGIGFNGIKQVAPATGTTAATCMTAFATAFTNTATTITQIAVTSTSLKTWMRSVTLATSGTAGQVATHFTGQAEVCGAGGYFFVARFYVGGTVGATQRGFHGLAAKTTALTNLDWTNEFSLNKVGLAYSLVAGVGTWKVVASTTSAAMNPSVDLGSANFTVNNTDVIELILFCAPNASSIGYRVTNLTQAVTLSGTLSSNIPLTSAALNVHHFVTNNGTGAIATFGLNKWYLESDY